MASKIDCVSSADIIILRDGAKKAFTAGDFYSTIRLLDQAFTLAKSQPGQSTAKEALRILDLRVAVHIKTMKLQRALKDSLSMIRFDRKDARGYIRCAEVKTLQEDPKAALTWYARGLRNVPQTSKLCAVLKAGHDQIMKASEVHFDPATKLPREILQLILSFFNYRELTSFMRVSKKWRDAVLSMREIQRTLDFSMAGAEITKASFQACLRRLSLPPTKVVDFRLCRSATAALRNRLCNWKTVEHLELYEITHNWLPLATQQRNLRKLYLDSTIPITLSEVQQCLMSCPSLQDASFNGIEPTRNTIPTSWKTEALPRFPTLRKLEMACRITSHEPVGYATYPYDFLECFPNVEILSCVGMKFHQPTPSHIVNLSNLVNLRVLVLQRMILAQFPPLPASIETICFRNWKWDYSDPSLATHNVFSTDYPILPRLTDICLEHISAYLKMPLERIVPSKGARLKVVQMHDSGNSLAVFLDLLGRSAMEHVVDLGISWTELDDDDAERFALFLPKLQSLYLHGVSVSGVFIKTLAVRPASELMKLVLADCPCVSVDAIHWARGQGIDVRVMNPESHPFRGRKIGYTHR